jgi:hypothetical protein
VTRPFNEQELRQTRQSARPYHAPQLSVYGAMKTLTAGGTTQANENAVGFPPGQGLRRP